MAFRNYKKRHIRRGESTGMAGIYIHIPFCKTKCGYCDFYSLTALGRMDELLASIEAELHMQKRYLGSHPAGTIYFGGGTPSLCKPSDLGRIIDTIKKLWDTSGLTEVTVEANPDDIDEKLLDGLLSAGVNRLSIGVQSFIDRDLRFMGRRHNANTAYEAVKMARRTGFGNITADLIYGIPGMSSEEWRDNIRQAVESGVQHISAYHLIIEEGTPFGRLSTEGLLSPVPDERSEEQYLLLHGMLTGAGFEHYEISNFALPGFRAVHNASYWTGGPYLGVGPSAHSYNGRERRSVISSLDGYIAGVGTDSIYSTEILTPEDLHNEFIMTSFRCAEGVDSGSLGAKFGEERAARFKTVADKYVKQGVIERDGDYYRILPEKYMVSDYVISDFFI